MYGENLMDLLLPTTVLPAAFILDLIMGDPRFLPHPIRWMGNSILVLEPLFRKITNNLVVSGALLSIFLITFTGTSAYLIMYYVKLLNPLLGTFVELILVFYTISAKSLKDSAMDVYRALKTGKLEDAKDKVKVIVGREVDKLDKSGVSRAAVETVGENLVDGVISPVFYAAIGGAPLAMAYKMINTLDSMIGYKNKKYLHFGKAAARIDDIANFIPSRISILIIAVSAQILGKRGSQALMTAIKEGNKHTSPNAGHPEAAFAGALKVKLGGPNYYHGNLVSKPFIGENFKDVDPVDIKKACILMMLSSALWVALCTGIMITMKFVG